MAGSPKISHFLSAVDVERFRLRKRRYIFNPFKPPTGAGFNHYNLNKPAGKARTDMTE